MKPFRPFVWLLPFSMVLTSACGDDLGECDEAAAETLVFGRSMLAATAGQALAHDSCGNGVFCHSSRARGDNRVGAPYGLDFDMVPDPHGWNTLRKHAQQAWEAVDEGTMPPRGIGSTKVGDGDWSYVRARHDDSPRLVSIYTAEGKEIFRNWLACEMPIVEDTMLPPPIGGISDSGTGTGDDDSGAEPAPDDWGAIYADIIEPSCALSSCHDDRSNAGNLKMDDACGAFEALLHATGPCDKQRVIPGEPGSFLLEKINDETPSCGSRMPSTGRLLDADIARISEWIASGAHAAECE